MLFLRKVLLVLIVLHSSQLKAQEISFRQLTSEDGISQSEIYCFLHDSKGYMWFGTLDGLNRYDGYSIQTFKMERENPNSIIHNTIYSLTEDKFGRIWIGTDNGLSLYDTQREMMYTVPNFYSGKKLIIRTLLADERDLWVGTNEGLFRITIPKKTITAKHLHVITKTADHVDLEIHGKKAIYTSIYRIEKAENGCIWLGTWEGALGFNFSPERKPNYRFYSVPDSSNKITEVTSLVEDVNNNIWIGTQRNGLYRFSPENKELKNFRKSGSSSLLSDNIKALISDQQGNVWIGTFKDGLQKIDSAQLLSDRIEFSAYKNNEFKPGSLNSNLIRSLYVSADGLLWIGTLGKGINIYNPYQKKFNVTRIPPDPKSGNVNNFIRSVYKDAENNLWLGLHYDGLIRYDMEEKSFKSMGMKSYFTLFHMHPCKKDYFWIASSSGAHIVSPGKDEVSIMASVNFKEAPEIMASNACFNIEKTAQDVYWIASMSGIARVKVLPGFNLETRVYNIKSSPAISINNTRVLLYDSLRNILWAGTEGGGLNEILLNEEQFPDTIIFHQSQAGNLKSLSSNYIRSLCLDNENHLYVGTYEGLNKLVLKEDSSGYNIKVWKTADGLGNNMVQSIESDDNGFLWLGTNGGLSKFDPIEEKFINYKISDGLQSNEFSEHTSYKTPDGELIFGGINGVNIFYPEKIQTNPLTPNITITDFYLFNEKVGVLDESLNHMILEKPIGLTDTLILRSKENDIRFDFSAQFYADPQKIRYKYILEGYDEDWVVTDANQRVANYTNLPYGDYTFKVKATNNEGLWYDKASTIQIHINRPFYLKWWAFLIYFSLFLTFLWYFARYSVIRITTKEKLVYENEHNQRLHELDVLRTKFFINVSHDLRTPLTLITGPMGKILNNFSLDPDLKRQLDLVYRSANRLRYLVEQLLDFRKAEAGKLSVCLSKVDLVQFIRRETEYFNYALEEKGIDLHFIHDKQKVEAWIDKDMMAKVIFNLMSNAIKYTAEGVIFIKIWEGIEKIQKDDKSERKWIKIEIEDSGKGMSKEKAERIFERFYQDPQNPGKGYGIGLSHTMDLVKAHQGNIEVQSTPGKGTKFTIHLPNEYDEEKIVASKETAEVMKSMINPGVLKKPEVDLELTERKNLKSILVVEDSDDLREFISMSLQDKYRVVTGSDGQQGLLKAKKLVPDLIISDIMMPKMDGVEFCRQIKSNVNTSHIPVVLLTARIDDETKYKGIETGADDYISKPFDMEYLILRIQNLLRTRENLRKLFRNNLELEPSAVTVNSTDEEFLKKLMAAIEEGIPDSEFSIETLEKQLGMSHTNFYRKIKNLTGQSGKELLQNMRLKRAAQLLSQQKQRISDVAYMTGFTNPKYFSKCFKEKYSFSPSEYQNQMAQNSE